MTDGTTPTGTDVLAPLAGMRVTELDGEFCPYAGRLLTDLGAAVTRVRRPGDDAGALWPLHRGKTELVIDPTIAEDRRRLSEEIDYSDVLLQSAGAGDPIWLGDDVTRTREERPRLIHAVLTPYGLDGPHAECPSTDLTRLAAGGLLWLGGYPDAEPVAPYGNQSALCTAIFAAVAVLLATIERDRTGAGALIEVSAQEALVQALETSLAEYELTGAVRKRAGSSPREAGTGLYQCADGFVSMVAGRLGTAKAWGRLREWLVESGTPGADELWAPEWESLEFRQRAESIARFAEIFGEFARRRGKQELYLEAQQRNIAVAPVNAPHEVLADAQLHARGFLFEATDPTTGASVTVPGPAFRFHPATDPVPTP